MLRNLMPLLAEMQSTVADTARTVADSAKTAFDTAKTGADSLKVETNFFKILDDYSGGVLVLFFALGAIVLLVQWWAWIFLKGRFQPKRIEPGTGTPTGTGDGSQPLRVVFVEFFTKIIDDFRHLLALLMVVIFALTLGFMIFRAGKDMTKMTDAVQVVVATLGGLLGSILGYYFGESAAQRTRNDGKGGESKMPPVQNPPKKEEAPRDAPSPDKKTEPVETPKPPKEDGEKPGENDAAEEATTGTIKKARDN